MKKIVGLGGSMRANSASALALDWMLAHLRDQGAETASVSGAQINFPMFDGGSEADPAVGRWVEAVRNCDALIVATPVYHGAPSGLIKNALDHLQPLNDDRRPYLTGRAVCCIAAGGGVTGAVTALSCLRDVVHALRGWPTPMHVPIDSSAKPFDEAGTLVHARTEKLLTAALGDLALFLGADIAA